MLFLNTIKKDLENKMCGIIGFVGQNNIEKHLIEGLKKLEYRGYDSAGLCINDIEGGLQLIKKKGEISKLELEVGDKTFQSNVGIAHTRWATHGIPNQINAHPHISENSEIAIVHNGIIENYTSLKIYLQNKGYQFLSQTDSEVLVHLIDDFYNGDILTAVTNALQQVEGTYGVAVIHSKEDKMVVARCGSPLLIGLGKDMMMVASDAIPILKHTDNVIYLEDNDVAEITSSSYNIYKLSGEIVDREIEVVKLNINQIEKRGFKHFMLKEIIEQPEAMQNTLRGRIKEGKIKLSVDLDVKKLNRIVLTACGTSWHSALVGKYFLENFLDISVEVDYASEFRYRNTVLHKNDLFIVLSQSGETADTLAALRKARQSFCKTLGIVNMIGSTIAREVDSGIYLHAGPEIGVASTKAYLCQLTGLLLLALYIKQERGEKLPKDILEELQNLPGKIREIIKHAKQIRVLAYRLFESKNFLYLGRGVNFPAALEGALKLKEISYIHAEGYPAAEMKHGPIALIDENMPVVFIAAKGKTLPKIISNMEEVKSRGGEILTITDSREAKLCDLSRNIYYFPQTIEILSPFLTVIPMQFLAYYIADLKGINVDKPRNLAKSVTVE